MTIPSSFSGNKAQLQRVLKDVERRSEFRHILHYVGVMPDSRYHVFLSSHSIEGDYQLAAAILREAFVAGIMTSGSIKVKFYNFLLHKNCIYIVQELTATVFIVRPITEGGILTILLPTQKFLHPSLICRIHTTFINVSTKEPTLVSNAFLSS